MLPWSHTTLIKLFNLDQTNEALFCTPCLLCQWHQVWKGIHYKLPLLTLDEPESSLTGKRCSSKDGPLIIDNFFLGGGDGFCGRVYVSVHHITLVAMNME
jgi:hypothetical protein